MPALIIVKDANIYLLHLTQSIHIENSYIHSNNTIMTMTKQCKDIMTNNYNNKTQGHNKQ